MKRIRKLAGPTPGLSNYLEIEAEADYREFKSYQKGAAYRELVARLTALQRGLCGYCEINLTELDRQVEHVAPQSDQPEAVLDVSNMIACCTGGTGKNLYGPDVGDEEERYFSPPKRNLSCGQAKGDTVDHLFLDPRTLPALPSLLTVRYNGQIEADDIACQSEGVAVGVVEKTIAILGLNVKRLQRAREKRWKDLSEIWAPEFNNAHNMTEAARRELLPNQDGCLPKFFTTRRSFFGNYGEQVLSLRPDRWI